MNANVHDSEKILVWLFKLFFILLAFGRHFKKIEKFSNFLFTIMKFEVLRYTVGTQCKKLHKYTSLQVYPWNPFRYILETAKLFKYAPLFTPMLLLWHCVYFSLV